jgi:GNAT superfamily N-acetyltransferase
MNPEYMIRTAQRADAPAIYAIHQASLLTLCQTHYPLDLLQRWFARKTVEGYYPALDAGEMFVCERDQRLVGFGHAVPGVIEGLFVHPDFAGQGVGTAMLNYAIIRASDQHSGPITIAATLNAEAFYARHGFCVVRRYSFSRPDVEFPVVEMRLER